MTFSSQLRVGGAKKAEKDIGLLALFPQQQQQGHFIFMKVDPGTQDSSGVLY
jgi:hypothetical protein